MIEPSKTAYDDGFITLLNDNPELIIPIINITFHTSYKGNEKIIFLKTDYY